VVKTAVLEGRCDIRDLAVCALFMLDRKCLPRTKSALFGQCIETLAKAAIQLGTREFKTHEEAQGFLIEIGLGPIVRKKGDSIIGAKDLSLAIRDERRDELDIDLNDDDAMKARLRVILDKLNKGVQ